MNTQPIIDTRSINEQVYQFLRQRITSFAYSPGSKVDVRLIQKQLNVSETPIKYALSRLDVEGLVEIHSRRGTFVKAVTEKDFLEIFEIRLIIEPAAGEIVATQTNPERLKEMKRLYQEALNLDNGARYSEFLEKSGRFDVAIVHATGNDRLSAQYNQLKAHMQLLLFRFPNCTLGRRNSSNEEHGQILAALEVGDPKKTRETIRRHLLNVREFYLEAYKSRL